MTENKKLEVIFAPGCFDDFEGTQEELDDMMNEIRRLAESGELQERAEPIDIDLVDDINEVIARKIAEGDTTRKLH